MCVLPEYVCVCVMCCVLVPCVPVNKVLAWMPSSVWRDNIHIDTHTHTCTHTHAHTQTNTHTHTGELPGGGFHQGGPGLAATPSVGVAGVGGEGDGLVGGLGGSARGNGGGRGSRGGRGTRGGGRGRGRGRGRKRVDEEEAAFGAEEQVGVLQSLVCVCVCVLCVC